jgi:hypothetical protein
MIIEKHGYGHDTSEIPMKNTIMDVMIAARTTLTIEKIESFPYFIKTIFL